MPAAGTDTLDAKTERTRRRLDYVIAGRELIVDRRAVIASTRLRAQTASMKNSVIVVVAVHYIDGAVGLQGKGHIEWPGWKMTL
jgi:hypothetical protein